MDSPVASSTSATAAAWAHPLVSSLNNVLHSLTESFQRLPGSAIVLRYVASSYQNDPIRSLLELFLLVFAVRTILQSRTRGGQSGSNFVKLAEKVRLRKGPKANRGAAKSLNKHRCRLVWSSRARGQSCGATMLTFAASLRELSAP